MKTDLETAFPEKKWEIVKFCDPLKGEFGNIISITCEYGVKSDNVIAKDLQPYIVKHAEAQHFGFDTTDGNSYAGVEDASCLTASSGILGGHLASKLFLSSRDNLLHLPRTSLPAISALLLSPQRPVLKEPNTSGEHYTSSGDSS